VCFLNVDKLLLCCQDVYKSEMMTKCDIVVDQSLHSDDCGSSWSTSPKSENYSYDLRNIEFRKLFLFNFLTRNTDKFLIFYNLAQN
jgi:hypothetical protein